MESGRGARRQEIHGCPVPLHIPAEWGFPDSAILFLKRKKKQTILMLKLTSTTKKF